MIVFAGQPSIGHSRQTLEVVAPKNSNSLLELE
jgi:hypothetical protein